MSTINDIARETGFGIGTISRVLNGEKNVSEKTKSIILETIKKLNYKPNKIARKLVKGNYSLKTIGIVMPVIVNPFYFEILKGIYDKLMENHHNILLFNLGTEDRDETFRHIIDENLSGIIFLSEKIPENVKELLKIGGIIYIYVDFFEKDENCFFIDNKSGGILSAKYFIEKNKNKIIYIGESTFSQQQTFRFEGFNEELEKNNIKLIKEIYIKNSEEESYKITKELLMGNETEGIFYFCDNMAYGGIKAKKELNSNVSIVGYDDLLPSKYLGLTSIFQPAYQLGSDGAEFIINLIKSNDSQTVEKYYNPILVERES